MDSVITEPRFTVKEAAKESRMSEAWWRKAIFEKRVKVVRVGGRVFLPQSSVHGVCRIE